MSAVLGVNATLIAAGGVAKIANGLVDARVKVMIDSYEASALASASTIKMGGTLPAGAKVVEVLLWCDQLSTSTHTLDVGDSDDADRYITLLAANAAAASRIDEIDGQGYVIGTASGDNQIVVRNSGLSAATGTIKVAILYTMD